MIKVHGNLNSGNYIVLLQSNRLPDCEDGQMFHKDGFPCHTSRATKRSLADEDFQPVSI